MESSLNIVWYGKRTTHPYMNLHTAHDISYRVCQNTLVLVQDLYVIDIIDVDVDVDVRRILIVM